MGSSVVGRSPDARRAVGRKDVVDRHEPEPHGLRDEHACGRVLLDNFSMLRSRNVVQQHGELLDVEHAAGRTNGTARRPAIVTTPDPSMPRTRAQQRARTIALAYTVSSAPLGLLFDIENNGPSLTERWDGANVDIITPAVPVPTATIS